VGTKKTLEFVLGAVGVCGVRAEKKEAFEQQRRI
jgi:hypothetical protein